MLHSAVFQTQRRLRKKRSISRLYFVRKGLVDPLSVEVHERLSLTFKHFGS